MSQKREKFSRSFPRCPSWHMHASSDRPAYLGRPGRVIDFENHKDGEVTICL